jgi:CBS domain-containing protein
MNKPGDEPSGGEPILVLHAVAGDCPTVPMTATLQEAARLLARSGLDLLPVTDEERVLGVIGTRELAVAGCGEGLDPASTTVLAVMTEKPEACRIDLPAREALARMRRQGLTAMPVYDRDARLAGVVSIHRLLDSLDEHATQGPEPEYVRRVRGEPL